MTASPYADSMWATKKRQFPFLVGPISIIYESSYGMTLRNPGQMKSDELRVYLDEAIERSFESDIERYTNSRRVRELLTMAGTVVEMTPEEYEACNITLRDGIVPGEIEAIVKKRDEEIVMMTIEDLIEKGFLTKGAQDK